jgi:hypothetical protein
MNISEYLDYVGNDWAKGWLLRGETQRSGVFVPFSFIDLCEGNLYEALILAQVMYWADVDTHKGGPRLSYEHGGHVWIVKTYEEWAKELHLNSWTTVRACITRLTEAKLIIKETHKSVFHGGGTALFLRPNWEIFEQKIRELAAIPRNTSDDIPGNTSGGIPSRNTSDDIPGNTRHVDPIYTENTPKITTPEITPASAENVEMEKGLPRKLESPFSISPEPQTAEKEPDPMVKRVREIMAALTMAKIRFPGAHFKKREQLINDAIIDYGFREVKKAVQESEKENARWWSYVDTKLRAKRKITDELTGEDYITGKYADYIEH